jgi:hypothetical protein
MLFRVARNKPIRGTELLDDFQRQLVSILPSGWKIDSHRPPRDRAGGVDAVLNLTSPNDETAWIWLEVKRVVEPRDVAATLDNIKARALRTANGSATKHLVVLAAPYLSPTVRERLARAGAGWFDTTGNLRIQLERPALFIDRPGATRNPYTDPDDRRLRSLRGPGAARVVRVLLDGEPPNGVRALAAAAEVGLGTSSRVLDLLAREELVDRDDKGAVLLVRKRSLVERWAQDYGLTTTNNGIAALAPRGLDRLLDLLVEYDGRYALTGSAAARTYRPEDELSVVPLTLCVMFVPDAVTASRDLAVRRTDRGSNLLLIEPFDEVVYRGARVRDGLKYVSPSQAVADLLTGPGRSAEEAEQLLEVLAREDPAWAR